MGSSQTSADCGNQDGEVRKPDAFRARTGEWDMNWKLAALALALSACGAPETDTAPAAPAPAEPLSQLPPEAPVAEPEIAYILPGRYCYFRAAESSTEGLDLTISDGGAMAGEHFGSIHDEASAYYAAFVTELTGGETGPEGRVTFQSVTEVDGDTQYGEEMWVITPELARLDAANVNDPLLLTDCAGLRERVWPPVEE